MAAPFLAAPAVKAWGPALMGLLKLFGVLACIALLVYAGKAVYDDQVEVRERIITESVGKALAERNNTVLQDANKLLKGRADDQAVELWQARQAIQALNSKFSEIKTTQQATLAKVRGIEADLETKPAPEVEAAANALMDDFNSQMEALYP